MKMQTREIQAECIWENGRYIVKILQIDANNLSPTDLEPNMLKYGVTAEFNEDLVLTDINVDHLQGSRKALCFPFKETVKQLIGAQVGKDFGMRIMQLSGGNFCMHFEMLLPQLASLAYRAKFFRIAHAEGNESFLEAYGKAFKGKCVGWRDLSIKV